MFGSLFLPLIAYLVYLWKHVGNLNSLKWGIVVTFGGMILLLALAVIFGYAIVSLPIIGSIYLESLAAGGAIRELFSQVFIRRLSSPGAWITLGLFMSFVLGLLWPRKTESNGLNNDDRVKLSHRYPIPYPLNPVHVYVLLLLGLGLLAVIGVDFFYLRDQFGWRMNTIFKFYYQAWLLWGLAAAFGSAVLLQELRGKIGIAYRIGLIIVICTALVYPVLGLWSKTNGFRPQGGLNLDGTAYYADQNPDEMAAIRWLQSAAPGVLLEAVGGSYSSFARISAMSGKPTVLGWPGHESQWRGGAREMGSRQSDVERIYRSSNWEEVQTLLSEYDVKYIYIGSLERSTYGVNEGKFMIHLAPVFEQGEVKIYQVP